MFQHVFIFQPCVNLEKPTMKQPLGFHPAWPGRRADTRPPQIADPLPWHPPTTPAWRRARGALVGQLDDAPQIQWLRMVYSG